MTAAFDPPSSSSVCVCVCVCQLATDIGCETEEGSQFFFSRIDQMSQMLLTDWYVRVNGAEELLMANLTCLNGVKTCKTTSFHVFSAFIEQLIFFL